MANHTLDGLDLPWVAKWQVKNLPKGA